MGQLILQPLFRRRSSAWVKFAHGDIPDILHFVVFACSLFPKRVNYGLFVESAQYAKLPVGGAHAPESGICGQLTHFNSTSTETGKKGHVGHFRCYHRGAPVEAISRASGARTPGAFSGVESKALYKVKRASELREKVETFVIPACRNTATHATALD